MSGPIFVLIILPVVIIILSLVIFKFSKNKNGEE